MNCPLCQHGFSDRAACHACGLINNCKLLRCPQCGYEFVEESKILSWLLRVFRRPKRLPTTPGHEPFLLSRQPVLASRRIVSVSSQNNSRIDRLAVLGIVPGTELMILQKSPCCVIRIGETELALDSELVDSIFVEPVGDEERQHVSNR